MLSMTSPTVVFDQPVLVELARHPNKFRVLGVKREKNPNGIGRGKHSYAVAQWFFNGKWKRVTDLVQQMRLANAVEHDLGHNPEAYANVDGDKILREMRYDFRIVYHTPEGKTLVRFPADNVEDSVDELARILDQLVHDGDATGGHLEEFVDGGIGWVMENAGEDA